MACGLRAIGPPRPDVALPPGWAGAATVAGAATSRTRRGRGRRWLRSIHPLCWPRTGRLHEAGVWGSRQGGGDPGPGDQPWRRHRPVPWARSRRHPRRPPSRSSGAQSRRRAGPTALSWLVLAWIRPPPCQRSGRSRSARRTAGSPSSADTPASSKVSRRKVITAQLTNPAVVTSSEHRCTLRLRWGSGRNIHAPCTGWSRLEVD